MTKQLEMATESLSFNGLANGLPWGMLPKHGTECVPAVIEGVLCPCLALFLNKQLQ